MAYYDTIAKQWHEATGYKGGPFKELVLNNALLKLIPNTRDCSILELGAGNGYFLPIVLRRYSGQLPKAVVVTDLSEKLLQIAKKHFSIPDARYLVLDVRRKFPFGDGEFDLIIATMIFNEVSTGDFESALQECHRVLSDEGLLLITVTHPDFITDLQNRGKLKKMKGEQFTMPGSGRLKLPVIHRSIEAYRQLLTNCGFHFDEEEIFPTVEVLNVKAGLRNARGVPLALIFTCKRLPKK